MKEGREQAGGTRRGRKEVKRSKRKGGERGEAGKKGKRGEEGGIGKETGVSMRGRKEKSGKWEKWSERDGDGENEDVYKMKVGHCISRSCHSNHMMHPNSENV